MQGMLCGFMLRKRNLHISHMTQNIPRSVLYGLDTSQPRFSSHLSHKTEDCQRLTVSPPDTVVIRGRNAACKCQSASFATIYLKIGKLLGDLFQIKSVPEDVHLHVRQRQARRRRKIVLNEAIHTAEQLSESSGRSGGQDDYKFHGWKVNHKEDAVA